MDNEEEEQEATLNGRFRDWPSSRIVRVSKASAGKDRHSKVITSKGLRDRRVRLSVNTAIQFYDLQDRLGYDQPSKAVEWLLKAAAGSIAELPPMSTLFPDTPTQHSDETTMSRSNEQLGFDETGYRHGRQPPMKMASASSSPSDTSKGGSGLSLCRSESRIKGKGPRLFGEENESCHLSSNSFTELLSGTGYTNNISSSNHGFDISPNGSNNFSSGLMIRPNGQMQFVNSPMFSNVGEDHHHHHHHHSFSFSSSTPDNLAPAVNGSTANSGGSGYNLDFTMSSVHSSGGVNASFNRGTLQSNSSSPSLLPHQVQRFLHPSADGSHPPSFLAPDHQGFFSGLDGSRLQLYNGGSNNSVQISKGKGKN